jgi:hypothetical protein
MKESKQTLGRRRFLNRSAQLVATASVVAGRSEIAKTEPLEQGPGVPPGFIIDSHIHCGQTTAWVDEMVRTYRPRGVMACVLTRFGDMDLIKKAMSDYPDLFIGYGYVDLDNQAAVREVEAFYKNGFVGMKFHSPQKDYDDPGYFQVYRMCEQYRLHMLFHTGVTSRRISDQPKLQSASRMRPMYLDTICRVCPRTTLQGAHLGNPWYEEAAEAARWNPNLFFDITGSTLLKLIKLGRLERLSEIFWWSSDESENNPHTLKGGPGAWDHVVFGTDEAPSGLAGNIDRFQKMLDANHVPEAQRAKMWGLTIAQILGIDPKTKRLMPRKS